MLNTKKSNSKKYIGIIDQVIKKMTKQGSGCFLVGHGNMYYNPETGTKDPLGIISNVSPGYLYNCQGAISDESMKPLVAHLFNKFDIDVSTENEYIRFVNFLQNIQDVHDNFTTGINESKFNLTEFVSQVKNLA